jgi:hypothetical protein
MGIGLLRGILAPAQKSCDAVGNVMRGQGTKWMVKGGGVAVPRKVRLRDAQPSEVSRPRSRSNQSGPRCADAGAAEVDESDHLPPAQLRSAARGMKAASRQGYSFFPATRMQTPDQ